jgi:uncharacterized low-complexity protein
MTRKKTIVTAALGTAFAASLAAAPIANAAQNPFGMDSLQSGYQIAQNKANEGKCGGDKDKEGKCGEGKCGGAK